jgi:hypothetical protein
MPRKGFRPEEIIAKLREADVLPDQGKRVAEVVRALGVSEVTPQVRLGGQPRAGAPRRRAARLPVAKAAKG